MNRTHALVLSFALSFSGLAFSQQTAPPVANPTAPPANAAGVATPAPAPAPAIAVRRDQAEIQSLVQQLNQAALTNDTATFDRLLAPNYQAVNASGVHETKTDILKAHRKNQIKYESIQNLGRNIQVQGNTAVEIGTAAVRGVYKGQRFDGTYRSTRTFQRQPDGSWQIVSFVVQKVS